MSYLGPLINYVTLYRGWGSVNRQKGLTICSAIYETNSIKLKKLFELGFNKLLSKHLINLDCEICSFITQSYHSSIDKDCPRYSDYSKSGLVWVQNGRIRVLEVIGFPGTLYRDWNGCAIFVNTINIEELLRRNSNSYCISLSDAELLLYLFLAVFALF